MMWLHRCLLVHLFLVSVMLATMVAPLRFSNWKSQKVTDVSKVEKSEKTWPGRCDTIQVQTEALSPNCWIIFVLTFVVGALAALAVTYLSKINMKPPRQVDSGINNHNKDAGGDSLSSGRDSGSSSRRLKRGENCESSDRAGNCSGNGHNAAIHTKGGEDDNPNDVTWLKADSKVRGEENVVVTFKQNSKKVGMKRTASERFIAEEKDKGKGGGGCESATKKQAIGARDAMEERGEESRGEVKFCMDQMRKETLLGPSISASNNELRGPEKTVHSRTSK